MLQWQLLCVDLEDYYHINVQLLVMHVTQGAVYIYYGLTNYYQNHRRYVASRDDNQLNGVSEPTANSLSSSCEPYRGYYNSSNEAGIPYAPCGSIANSLFNGGWINSKLF
jgi:hypothetical protein